MSKSYTKTKKKAKKKVAPKKASRKRVKKKPVKKPFDPSRPLDNRRWEAFCQNILGDIDENQRKAYIDAGYKARGDSADSAASLLLKNHKVSARLTYLKEQRAEECLIDSVYTINGCKEIFERCMQHEPVMERQGNKMVETGEYKFDSTGANSAIDKLMKANGDYKKDNEQKPQLLGNVTINVMSPAQKKKRGG